MAKPVRSLGEGGRADLDDFRTANLLEIIDNPDIVYQ